MKIKIVVALSVAGILVFGAAAEAATVTGGALKRFKTKSSAELAKTEANSYVEVQRMNLNFDTKEDGPMLVTYCAESAVDTDGGTIYVRLAVDNDFSPSFSIFGQGQADGEYSSQCVKWVFGDIDAGSHSVRVDYRATNGMAYQYYKTLTVEYNK